MAGMATAIGQKISPAARPKNEGRGILADLQIGSWGLCPAHDHLWTSYPAPPASAGRRTGRGQCPAAVPGCIRLAIFNP